jgi:hypothetical protein
MQDKVKVHVTLKNGQTFSGNAFIKSRERLQDILNDKRTFIPFEKLIEECSVKVETYKIIIVNKDSISSLEER